MSNLPYEFTEQDLKSHLKISTDDVKIKVFEINGKKMAYVKCLSIPDAFDLIVKFHNSLITPKDSSQSP